MDDLSSFCLAVVFSAAFHLAGGIQLPVPEGQLKCFWWFDYLERSEEGRPQFEYHNFCITIKEVGNG